MVQCNLFIMKKFALFLLLVLAVASCDKQDSNAVVDDGNKPVDSVKIVEGNVVEHTFTRAQAAPLEVSLSNEEAQMFESGYAFAAGLFGQVAGNASDENVCISPLSVQILLGMISNAAKDDIANQLIEMMFGQGVTLDAMNSALGKLHESLEATNCVSLSNAVWIQEGERFNEDFLNTGRNVYFSTVNHLDFRNAPQSAMDSVCQWAYDNSFGRLKSLSLDDFSCNTSMVLGNLAWFSSAWLAGFDSHSTSKGQFTLADGSVTNVEMMKMRDNIMSYKVLDKYRMLAFPFENNSFSMEFVVPADGYSLDSIIPEIDWSVELNRGKVYLQMPKFTVGYQADYKSILSALGMEDLFECGALDKLTNTYSDNASYLAQMKQDVRIKVDEYGVEAVAATVSNNDKKTEYYNFNIDRPFVFAIRDNASGSFLFMGRVNRAQ